MTQNVMLFPLGWGAVGKQVGNTPNPGAAQVKFLIAGFSFLLLPPEGTGASFSPSSMVTGSLSFILIPTSLEQ